jgi:hypothetical protein
MWSDGVKILLNLIFWRRTKKNSNRETAPKNLPFVPRSKNDNSELIRSHFLLHKNSALSFFEEFSKRKTVQHISCTFCRYPILYVLCAATVHFFLADGDLQQRE